MNPIMSLIRSQQNDTWEFTVNQQNEFKKLSYTFYKPTTNCNRNGLPVKLVCNDDTCEASLHRHPSGYFYIGSAQMRLKSTCETESFIQFLEKNGLKNKITVWLVFSGYTAQIFRYKPC